MTEPRIQASPQQLKFIKAESRADQAGRDRSKYVYTADALAIGSDLAGFDTTVWTQPNNIVGNIVRGQAILEDALLFLITETLCTKLYY